MIVQETYAPSSCSRDVDRKNPRLWCAECCSCACKILVIADLCSVQAGMREWEAFRFDSCSKALQPHVLPTTSATMVGRTSVLRLRLKIRRINPGDNFVSRHGKKNWSVITKLIHWHSLGEVRCRFRSLICHHGSVNRHSPSIKGLQIILEETKLSGCYLLQARRVQDVFWFAIASGPPYLRVSPV